MVHDGGVSDPFPSEQLSAFVRRLPAYGRLAWNLGRDPILSRARRGAVLAAAGYLVSPIDLIPGIIPVLGQLDDLLVLLAALRYALNGLDAQQRAVHLGAVGLSDATLAEDLRTLGTTAAWLARAGGRMALRVGRIGMRTGASVARRVAPTALRGAQHTGQAVQGRLRRPGSGSGSASGSTPAPGVGAPLARLVEGTASSD